MEWKSALFGVGATIMVLLTISMAMAAFTTGAGTINVPAGKTAIYFMMDNAQALELRDAICHNYHYETEVMDENMEIIPNPESCAQFADDKVKQFARDHVMAYRQWQAEELIDLGEEPQTSD